MNHTYKSIKLIAHPKNYPPYKRLTERLFKGNIEYDIVEPYKIYADLLNGLLKLNIISTSFENNTVRVEWNNGFAIINYSRYPDGVKKLLLKHLTKYENLT